MLGHSALRGLFSSFFCTLSVLNIKQAVISGLSEVIQVSYSKSSIKDLRPQPMPLPSYQLLRTWLRDWRQQLELVPFAFASSLTPKQQNIGNE